MTNRSSPTEGNIFAAVKAFNAKTFNVVLIMINSNSKKNSKQIQNVHVDLSNFESLSEFIMISQTRYFQQILYYDAKAYMWYLVDNSVKPNGHGIFEQINKVMWNVDF